MKSIKLAFLACLCIGVQSGTTLGQSLGDMNSKPVYTQTAYQNIATACDCGETACGCEASPETGCGCDDGACDASSEPLCGCDDGACDASSEPLCGCDDACDSMGGSSCGCNSGCAIGKNCDLGDPYTLFGSAGNWSAGGWLQAGYHNKNLPLFNNHRNKFNAHQAWLYAEKSLDTRCGFDIGGRIDYVYGVDAQDTQAFGSDPDGWDNDWDHGIYGHALPQAYGEIGYQDLSIKFGHFFTLIGWEVVPAPDNFFYSHAYTMYNSEPFTHTGVLLTHNPCDEFTWYGGYTLGWDTGFEDNGDNFLGGFSASLSDSVTMIYQTTIGRFGEARNNGVGNSEKGYMHSIVFDIALSDNLQYIYQGDYLDTENGAGNTVRNTVGINQYLLYTINDCLSTGLRCEWYESRGVYNAVTQNDDIYAVTLGANYKPHANLIFRPEIRFDWDSAQIAGLEDGDEQTTFGFDTIVTF